MTVITIQTTMQMVKQCSRSTRLKQLRLIISKFTNKLHLLILVWWFYWENKLLTEACNTEDKLPRKNVELVCLEHFLVTVCVLCWLNIRLLAGLQPDSLQWDLVDPASLHAVTVCGWRWAGNNYNRPLIISIAVHCMNRLSTRELLCAELNC